MPTGTTTARRRNPALTALGWFWAVVLAVGLAGGGVVQYLGPPPVPQAASPAPAPAPAPAMATPAPPAAAPPAAAPPATAPAAQAPEAGVVPPVASAAPSGPRAPGAAIPPGDPALLEPSGLADGGMLPRIGPDGRAPMRAYAGGAPPKDARPRVALLLGDFGMREADSEEALRMLPPAISFAVSPYAVRPGELIVQARATGHELWLALPMEPRGFPLDDPGNRAMLTGAPPAQNEAQLRWVLSRLQGYAGTTGALGSLRGERFATSPQMADVLAELGRRGLMYVDPRVGGQLPALPPGTVAPPRRAVDLVIDEPGVRTEIEAKLARLEQIAKDRGSALGLASAPVPVTVERLAAWVSLLAERGVVLVPVSALLLTP